MKVTAIQCPKCKVIVYSRAHHDCRSCLCGACYIDGGFDYVRVGYDQKIGSPEQLVMEVNADKGQLYHDWNNGENAFGMILPKIQNKRKEKRSMNKKVIPELQEHGRKKRKFIK